MLSLVLSPVVAAADGIAGFNRYGLKIWLSLTRVSLMSKSFTNLLFGSSKIVPDDVLAGTSVQHKVNRNGLDPLATIVLV